MNADLSQVVPLPEYQEQRKHIFPSKGSLEWFVRKHRAELVESGGLLLLAGRWSINVPQFDSSVTRIGQQLANGTA
jgi:hypothetical protein